MTTRVEMVARVRRELGDTVGGSYVWADTLVLDWLNEGLREVARRLGGVRREVSLTASTGQRVFDLGNAVLIEGVKSVVVPPGHLIEAGEADEQTAGLEQCWQAAYGPSTKITLRYALTAGQNLAVVFQGYPNVPTSDSDALEIGLGDECLLVWYVCGRARGWLDEQRSKRGSIQMGAAETGPSADYYHALFEQAVRSRRQVVRVKG